MPPLSAEFLQICAERIASGEAKYGPVRADERNRCQEAKEELYDAYNYIVPIMLRKHPRIKLTDEWQNAVVALYRAYRAVVALQAVERRYEAPPAGKEGDT